MQQKSETQLLKERIIEESFGWLKDYDVTEVDGKKMMTLKGEDVPFNVATVMDESEFIAKYLIPFALGNHHGKNYFPMGEWTELSGDGTQSVMVVDENQKPILLIPPLTSTNLGPEQYRVFRHIEQAVKQISADNMLKENPMASAALAQQSGNALSKVTPRTVTDLVSPWYYESKGIVPEIEQKVYYILNNINGGKVPQRALDIARKILYRAHRNEPVTQDEKDFIIELVKGQFDVDFGDGSAKPSEEDTTQVTRKPSEPEEDYNPLEC